MLFWQTFKILKQHLLSLKYLNENKIAIKKYSSVVSCVRVHEITQLASTSTDTYITPKTPRRFSNP